MRSSPYGHPFAFSTTNGVRVQIGSPGTIDIDLHQDSNRSLAAGGSTTIDSVVATEGMLVLCSVQTTTTQEGLYYVDAVVGATCTLVRVPGFQAGDSINPGTVFRVRSGAVYAGRKLTVQGTAPLVLGTDALTVEMEPDASAIASTAGGALVGLADAGAYFTTDTVEAALQQLGPLLGVTKIQLATGTLVGGTCTISTGIVVAAGTKAFPIPAAVITGSTNFGCLVHLIASNVAGVAGVGSIIIRALGNDGAQDVDAAGTFHVLLVN